jgi:Ribbon-helix-helix protein, copG family
MATQETPAPGLASLDRTPPTGQLTINLLASIVPSGLISYDITMPDILVRDIPENIVAAIDANAQRLGISRSEYLRRTLAREQRPNQPLSAADLSDFCETFSDLADDDVMDAAWR